MQKVAAFDFDGTLTDRDMFFGFLLYVNGAFRTYLKLFGLLPYFIYYLFGGMSRHETKEKVISALLSGKNEEELKFLGKKFALDVIPYCMKEEGMTYLKNHLNRNERVMIVSASIPYYLEPWAKSMGIDEVFCTQLVVQDEKITGKLKGKNCWGPEKERILKEMLQPRENFELYAYGNSRGDKEMLAFANHGVKI